MHSSLSFRCVAVSMVTHGETNNKMFAQTLSNLQYMPCIPASTDREPRSGAGASS